MKFVRIKEILEITGLSKATIYRYIAEDKFPKPVSLGGRAVAWIDNEIDDWISSKIESRDETQ